MTTIIIIVVVALVFFVTICVATFMIWKREAQMRTDSIKGIENSLEDMLHELTGGSPPPIQGRSRKRNSYYDQQEAWRDDSEQEADDYSGRDGKDLADPFSWMRTEQNKAKAPDRMQPPRKAEEDEMKRFEPELSSERTSRKVRWVEVRQEAAPQEEESIQQEEKRKEAEPILQEPEEREELQAAPEEFPPEPEETEPEPEQTEELLSDDFEDYSEKTVEDLLLEYTEAAEDDFPEEEDEPIEYDSYDMGKSGKKYTVTELEVLIQE